jgi:Winged helix DNA-binding domain
MPRTLSARQLNRATLDRQLLLRRASLGLLEAVRRITALQAQEPASPYIALWNRLARFDPRKLDQAFARGDLVKGSLMRITLHAVTADDYPVFHTAMQPSLRAARYNDRRFTNEGVELSEVQALIPDLRTFMKKGRTNREVERWVEQRLGAAKPRVWWALRHVGPFVHGATGGPWSFGPRPSYVASPGRAPAEDPDGSVQVLVRRYLEGFGPASVADIAQFGTHYRPPVQQALRAMEDDLVRYEGPGGVTLYDVPNGRLPREDVAAPPRLMAMWDSVLLAYADRSRIIPPDYRRLVMRNNGDVLPTVLVDGYVAGVWRMIESGIEVTAFHPLPGAAWTGLEREAARLHALLADRDPAVYRRYVHWWKGLPAAETRVVAG